MNLSKNFTLEELTYSDTAKSLGINNTPPTWVVRNLGLLSNNLLQPLRNKLGKSIIITSGYRCEELNKKIGGASNSQHTRGQAVDIYVPGLAPKDLYEFIKSSGLIYDQLILEQTKKAQWIHISYCSKLNRQQNLIYKNNHYILDV